MKTIRLDSYVIDTLLRDLVGHDKAPSAFAVYLFLWSRAAGRNRSVRISHHGISVETGLSKSAVQAAVRHLNQRRLIRSERDTPTSVPEHVVLRPWAKR
jgi:hypothetical protein